MKFENWFTAQYGKRPKRINLSDDELEGLIQKMVEAKQELAMRQQYDAVRTVALYAWNIKEVDKGVS